MSIDSWRKSESRDIRPFFGTAALDQLLDGAQIRLFPESPFSDTTSYVLEDSDLRRLDIALRPNIDEAILEAASISRDELVLVTSMLNPFLKKTRVVHKAPLAAAIPEEISVGAEILDEMGGGKNTRIEVVICLSTQLPKHPGRPFLRGHWLSKKAFDLRAPLQTEEFDITPMDDEGWKARNLPPKTLYMVDYFGSINEAVSKDEKIAKVYLHTDVYHKLATSRAEKLATPIMTFLAAEIACELLCASFADWQDADTVTSRSPLASLLKRLDHVTPCTLENLKDLVREHGAARLRAILHAEQKTVRSLAEA